MEIGELEKRKARKQHLKQCRERAVIERDYLRLQQNNLNLKRVPPSSLRYH
jgi:hypothetical protein